MEKEIIFNGVKYFLACRGKYYLSSKRECGFSIGLHVAKYEHYHGVKVPKGMIVHHKDGDTHNDEKDNLELISAKDHSKIHGQKGNLKSLEKAREVAKLWHSSDEGIEFHKEHGKNFWKNRKPKLVKCDNCGIEHETLNKKDHNYCSTKCQQRFYKKHKINYVKKVCPICGGDYWHYKSKKIDTCGKKCAYKLRNLKQVNK